MAFKPGNPGRPKGAVNKLTNFKSSLLSVYEEIGGDIEFAIWAKKPENQNDFYKLLAKTLPKVIEGAGEDGAIIVRINNTAKRANGESGN